MNRYRRHGGGTAPSGAVVVRLARAGSRVVGFVRTVVEPQDEESVQPSEQKPADQVLRLAHSKAAPGADILVELEPGVAWDDSWGRLED